MSYLVFLAQWYNWPYLAGLTVAALTVFYPRAVEPAGSALRRRIGLERAAPRSLIRVFSLSIAVVGLTLNGAVHDYWPSVQEAMFLPVLVITLGIAALATRGLGQVLERHFPEIKAVGWGGPGLTGRQGRVVSQYVGTDYRAGRAQVMGDDRTLHMVWCKTREGEIPYGSLVELREYDEADGRYYVGRVD